MIGQQKHNRKDSAENIFGDMWKQRLNHIKPFRAPTRKRGECAKARPLCLSSEGADLFCSGRSSGSPHFAPPSHPNDRKVAVLCKAFQRLTAAGTAPDSHRIPFSDRENLRSPMRCKVIGFIFEKQCIVFGGKIF